MPKIICVGRNYTEHIKELNNAPASSPVIFMKPDSAVLQKNKPFFIPDFSDQVQYECELLVRINRLGKSIEERFAHKYYREIGLGIDFTARDLQQSLKEKQLPWELSKGFDGSAVIGSWIDKESLNPDRITFRLEKNGKEVQRGNTADMLFSIDRLIAYISQYFTLKIGDIIFTGTPAGVGNVAINDVLTGWIEEEQMFSLRCK